jgi:hypothetical protein
MTKKEMKKAMELEEKIQWEKVQYRKNLISSVKSFWDDCEATERYYKINNDERLVNGRISDEEKQSLIDRYEVLKNMGLKSRYSKDELDVWRNIYMIVNTNVLENNRLKLEKDLKQDDLLLYDTYWWEDKDIDNFLEIVRNCGYKRIQLFDSSTALMRDLSHLINCGCKVVDTNATLRKSWGGEEWNKDHDGLIIEL